MIKTKIKHWAQGKMKALNTSVINQFEYISRAEYLNNLSLNCIEQGISDKKYWENEIIVSLTTYGKRLYEVYLAIESIMQQTMKPNRIILWLSNEMKDVNIPIFLQKQQKRGLEIRYYKDILAYKKLIPTMIAFPSAAIITIDDDILFHYDLIENLVNAHLNNPGLVYCARMHRMKLLTSDRLANYSKWEYECNKYDISPFNFPTGGAGALYPPNCFNKEIFNEDVFMNICKYADDIWFKAMALLNNTMGQRIHTYNGKNLLINPIAQDITLSQINNGKKMNDIQLRNVFDKYNLYEKLTL